MSALDDVLNRIADELVDRVLVRVAERLSGKPAQKAERGGGVISRPPANGSTARRAALPRRSAPKRLPPAHVAKTTPEVQKRIDELMRFVEKAAGEGVSSQEMTARFGSAGWNLRSTLQKARKLGLLRMTGTKQHAKYFAL